MSDPPTYDSCAICGTDLDERATVVGEIELCGPECARTAWVSKEIYNLREAVEGLTDAVE